MANESIQIDSIVQQVFKEMKVDSVRIKQDYYNIIIKELEFLRLQFIQLDNYSKRGGRYYVPKYGFTPTDLSYKIQQATANRIKIYHSINNILACLRFQQQLTYSLYIKDLNNHMHRYVVPENQLDTFLMAVQQQTESMQHPLINYANSVIEQMENDLLLSKHMQAFMQVIDENKNKYDISSDYKPADQYEAFEYHYQKVDLASGEENFEHKFNVAGIMNWIKARQHDTIPWYASGDIGLTSVKSIDLNQKMIFLSAFSDRSLETTYALIQRVFASQILNANDISTLVKAFTPAVENLKAGFDIDLKNIVQNLISSLTTE